MSKPKIRVARADRRKNARLAKDERKAKARVPLQAKKREE